LVLGRDAVTEDEKTTALIVLADLLENTITVGNPAPRVSRIATWMRAEPEAGDLIVEMSTRFRGQDHNRIGIFERYETRLVCYHETADVNLTCGSCSDEERCQDRFTWIQCLDPGAVHRHRWHNCKFLRLPTTGQQLANVTGDGTVGFGGLITRPTLINALEDAGFHFKDVLL
jgi:hypothetical protein